MSRRARGRRQTAPACSSIPGLLALLLSARIAVASDTSAGQPANRQGPCYAVLLLAGTLVYRPSGGSFEGPQQDLSPAVGAGCFAADRLAIELEVGPTLVRGKYTSFELRPAVLWPFHRIMYLAGRVAVPIDPEVNLVVLPAFGVTHTFANRIAPFFEVALRSAVGRGDPDLGLVHLLGLTYAF